MIWHAMSAAKKAVVGRGQCEPKGWDAFRKAWLKEKTGIFSLTEIPKSGGLFARVMGALEELSGDGIAWTVRADSGKADAAVAQHALGELLNECKLDHRYVTGIARQALKLPMIELWEMDGAQTETVLGIVRAQVWKGMKGKEGAV